MRRPWTAAWMIAVCCTIIGCNLPKEVGTRTAGWYDRVRGGTGDPTGAGGLYLQTALLDRAAPDPFLAGELWSSAGSTNPLSAEQTALFELNGLRVRIIGGIPPAKLVSLLSSDDAISPMARTVQAGVPKVVPINGPIEAAQFAVCSNLKADPSQIQLSDVECGLSITARSSDGGRVILRCEPEIQHGDRQQFLKPTADGIGFSRREQKSKETYPSLGFDVTLGSGEYLIVGPTTEPTDTIGQAYFFATVGDRVRQRVMVIRAGKVADATEAKGPVRPTTAAAAAQAAARPTARGVAD